MSCSADEWLFCVKCDLPVHVNFDADYFWHFDPGFPDCNLGFGIPCKTAIGRCPLIDDAGCVKEEIPLVGLERRDYENTGRIWMNSTSLGIDVEDEKTWTRFDLIYAFKTRDMLLSHLKDNCPMYLDSISVCWIYKHAVFGKYCNHGDHNCNYDLVRFRQVVKGNEQLQRFTRFAKDYNFDQTIHDEPLDVPYETSCVKGGKPDFDLFLSRMIVGTLVPIHREDWPVSQYGIGKERVFKNLCSCHFSRSFEEVVAAVKHLSDLFYGRRHTSFSPQHDNTGWHHCSLDVYHSTQWCCDMGNRESTDCSTRVCLLELACLPMGLAMWGCCSAHCLARFRFSPCKVCGGKDIIVPGGKTGVG